MRTARHTFTLLIVAAATCLAAGCGSNKDRIVGKWKIEAGPKSDTEKLAMAKMVMYMEFAKDGTFKFGLDVSDPVAKEKMGQFADMFTFTGKYTVSGDTLELLPGEGKEKDGPLKKGDNKVKIKFDGSDKMIITASDGDTTLTRMK